MSTSHLGLEQMVQREKTQRRVNYLVSELITKEKENLKISIIIGVTVFVFIICGALWLNDIEESSAWIPMIMFPGFGAFGIGYIIFRWRCRPTVSRIYQSYLKDFSSPDARLEADEILYDETQVSSTLTRFKRITKVITKKFTCPECGSNVQFDSRRTLAKCKKCESHSLTLPYLSSTCPFCGKKDTQILSPEEQVEPTKTDKKGASAGALMAGPVGLISGSIIDAISLLFREVFRSLNVASKGYVRSCGVCQETWGQPLQRTTTYSPQSIGNSSDYSKYQEWLRKKDN